MTPDQALVAELQSQLEAERKIRTQVSVSFRVIEARARALEDENKALKARIADLETPQAEETNGD